MQSKKWGAGAEPWTGRKPPHPPYLTRVKKAVNGKVNYFAEGDCFLLTQSAMLRDSNAESATRNAQAAKRARLRSPIRAA